MSILTTRSSHLSVDGTEYGGTEAVSAVIKSKANGFRPMGNLAADMDYDLEIVFGQDLTTSSLWTLMFTQAGETVPVVLKPYGNLDEPTAQKPWVSTTAIVMEPEGDIIGGASDASTTTRRTTTVTWSCDRPVLITTD